MFSYLYDRFFIKKPIIRHFVTKLLEGDRNIRVDLFGCSIQVNTLKEHGYLRASRMVKSSSLLRDEIPVLIHLASLLPSADAFIDIGANVGIFSSSLSKLCQIFPHLVFYAFEANPDTFSRLQETVSDLPVKTHNLALGENNGMLEFFGGAVSHVFTTVANTSEYQYKKQEKILLPCRRLDSIDISGSRIVMKIDVEGQELEVLRGAEDFFESNRVMAVYLDGYKNPEVENWLRRYGFDFWDGRSLKKIEGNVFSLLAIKNGINPPQLYKNVDA